MPGFFENVFTLLRSVVFYIFICVFLGAPLLEKHIETLSLAILLTCFTTVPLISIEECTTSRINSIYFSPNQPHEWFLAFLGYGSLFGAWASAGLLILDWNRPWQAWPYPCMMGASSGRCGPSSDYLSGLLSFLGKYSWAFNFRWVETVRDFQKGNEDQTEWHFGLRNHLNGWTEALESASFVQLKALVKGDDNASHHWPPDLVDFADQCRCYTRQLLLLTSVNPNLLRGKSKYGQLIQNIDAACVDFVPLKPRADRMVKKQPLKVNPKKAHEIDRMTSLVEWLLHARCKSSGEDPIPGTYDIYDARCGNFQTKPLFDELEIVDGAADSAGEEELVMPNFRYVVDIGSGLGHLPNSIARRLINDTNGCCSQKDNVSQMESVGNADSNNSFKPVCVIAVECNESMHIKACRSIDKTLQDNGVAELGLQHIERLLFRVEASDLDKLKSEITTAFLRRQRVTDEESVEPSAPPDYLVCGLHCCGDLGPSVIRLFNSHQQARSLLLVGCCYHKMALDTNRNLKVGICKRALVASRNVYSYF
ncbi:unnamed protein product [Calicophoron daubneyi]|uniref:Methyltransferase domain-containing protein n=1 Tax=Calicophoron daubneyi TaxID=300641 RepID=A0AAV2TIH3_CALDB